MVKEPQRPPQPISSARNSSNMPTHLQSPRRPSPSKRVSPSELWRYHPVLKRAYAVIVADIPEIDKNNYGISERNSRCKWLLRLSMIPLDQMASPTLLVFGAYPKMSQLDLPSLSVQQRLRKRWKRSPISQYRTHLIPLPPSPNLSFPYFPMYFYKMGLQKGIIKIFLSHILKIKTLLWWYVCTSIIGIIVVVKNV